MHTGIGCVGIVRFGSPAQKDRYLPKMATGEWIGSFALTWRALGFRELAFKPANGRYCPTGEPSDWATAMIPSH